MSSGGGGRWWALFASAIVALVGLVAVLDVEGGAAGTGDSSASVRVGFVRNYSIYTVSPDGHGTTLVLKSHPPVVKEHPHEVITGPDDVLYSQPAWSLDGQHLAVHAMTFESHEFQHVWVFDRKLKHIATFDSIYGAGGDSPSWSPDGRQLVFGDIWGGWIYLARLHNGVRALVDHFGAPPYDFGPSWSPRGSAIVFSRATSTGPTDELYGVLFIVKPNGTGLHQLLDQAVNATWSPDGRSIAFDDLSRIGVIDTSGRGLHWVVENGTHPAWSPDGSMIAFERGNDIWLVRLADGRSRLLVKNASDPTWTSR